MMMTVLCCVVHKHNKGKGYHSRERERSNMNTVDERGFYLILPSNVQPNLHKNNTASSFQTTFPTAYQLTGEWEVALTEVSYVNTMPTINAETFSINSSTLESDATTYSFKVDNVLYMPSEEKKKKRRERAAPDDERSPYHPQPKSARLILIHFVG